MAAKRMKDRGKPLLEIAEVKGLEIEEIERLKVYVKAKQHKKIQNQFKGQTFMIMHKNLLSRD